VARIHTPPALFTVRLGWSVVEIDASGTSQVFCRPEEYVPDHRPHGSLAADATEPACNGYLLTLACSCGVVFERWVTTEEAAADLLRLAALN